MVLVQGVLPEQLLFPSPAQVSQGVVQAFLVQQSAPLVREVLLQPLLPLVLMAQMPDEQTTVFE